jgi:D-hydroxyproline dehydrogenase
LKTAVVIGGGFVGVACAWQLQRQGLRVTLVDAAYQNGPNGQVPGQAAASWGNAGHLAIEQIDPLASLANLGRLPRRLFCFGGPVGLPWRELPTWLPFGLRLMRASTPARFAHGQRALSALLAQAMPAWQRLTAQTGTADCLREDGHFVAWESPESAARGKRHWLGTDTGTARVRPATALELAQLRARFNQRPVDAVRFENTGQILDLGRARAAMVQAFETAGGVVLSAKVLNISIANNVVKECREGGMELVNRAQVHCEALARTETQATDTLTPDVIVVAAGVDSAELLRPVVGTVPLIAERGYHLDAALTVPDRAVSALPALPALPVLPAHLPEHLPTHLPPVAFEDRSVIVTQFERTLRIAGFTEFASRDAPPDPLKWESLGRHAAALGLGVGSALLTQPARWMGARPTLPDYLPAIGQSQAADNLFYAFGHQHLGVTLAAITGELMAGLVSARVGKRASGPTAAPSESPQLDLAPYSLARFQ